MAHGVGERFLRDADRGKLHLRLEIRRQIRHSELDLEAGLADRVAIDRRSASVGSGARSTASPSARSIRTVPRIAVSASLAVSAIHPMLSDATSGRVSLTRSAACAADDDGGQVVGDDIVQLARDAVRSWATTRWASAARSRSSSALRSARVAADLRLPVHQPTEHHHAHRRELDEEHAGPVEGAGAEHSAGGVKHTAGSADVVVPEQDEVRRHAADRRHDGVHPPELVAVYPTTSTGSRWNSLCNVAP